ncbi:MAG: hypothetical protein M1831_006842 [Alyxoria varia]|nr:MAG: hypothetical protein M1831_006842 [Alyxoria varia]
MTAYEEGSLFYYAPNKGAPIAFAIFFAFSTVLHLYQNIHHKSWKLTGLLPIGAGMLCGGHAVRAVAAFDMYDDLGILVTTTTLLIMGPPVYAACLYVTYGRVIYYIPWLSLIHPGRFITTFIGLDIICELILGSGASRAANTSLSEPELKAGRILVRAGLILQCVLFAMWLSLAAHFHYQCKRHNVSQHVSKVLYGLYACGLLILERSILRTVEFFQMYTGTIYTSEPIFWVLEACPMLIVTTVLHALHPGRLMPASRTTFVATDGVTVREDGPGWGDKRPFWQIMVDPLDIGGMIVKYGGRNVCPEFWEVQPEPNGKGLDDDVKEKGEDRV